MRPLLISGFGTCLYTRKGLVIDERETGISTEYPPHQLPFDWVIVDNYTGYVSWSALRFLMAHAIPVVHMAWNGNLYGVTSPPGPIYARVKLGQYRTYIDASRRVVLASSFLHAKLALSQNHLTTLEGLYKVDSKGFGAEVSKHPQARWTDINRLLEFEAKCANVYWREYCKAVEALWPESGFISRGNTSYSWTRNAADPTNALLNYGYAILEARCRVAVVRAGFDPTIGYLHSIAPSKHPLVYDFQELGRALVDSVVLEMVRADHSVRTKGAFLRTTDWGLRLAPETAHELLRRLAFAFSRRIPGDRPMTWETALLREAQRFAEEVSIERRKPRAFEFDLPLPKIQPETLGNAGLAEKLAALSVPEARKLGISKTTLWYQQKRLREGAPVRVYRKVGRRLDLPAT
ncbi:MAG TPA: CRISPR-associated endonuclease Cas1 [Thermoplasmata archaeon]|nr:CRISPR-associated endonuclease Cas1 [Thermoplasmata archaeon]